MRLQDFIARIRRQIPSLTVESMSDAEITTELNISVNEINGLTQIYQGYTEFNFVPEQQIYKLSDVCPNYLGVTKNGVWWQDASGTFQYRIAQTITWLDKTIPNWRDAQSGGSFWYWINGNDLGFYPKPKEAYKCRIHHLMKATPMDNANNYPWLNTTTEVTAFQPLDKAIVALTRMRLSPSVGKEGNENPLEQEFKRELKDGMQVIRRRKDLLADNNYYQRIDGMIN